MNVVKATLETHQIEALREDTGGWRVTVTDNDTGIAKLVSWSDQQLGTVLALSISDTLPFAQEAYQIAEPLMNQLPQTHRIIP